MKKTLQALDDLIASIITLIPSCLGMLKSTRTLTAIGTVAALFITATQLGLDFQTALVYSILEVVTGVTLITGKTIRTGAPQNGQATSQSVSIFSVPKIMCPQCGKMVDDRTWCSECNAVLHPTVPLAPTYSTPPILQEIGANESTAYLKWFTFWGMLDWNLTNLNPQIRLEYAADILKEDKKRLDEAWLEELSRTKASVSAIPAPQDFESYQAIESFKKHIRDITPGCEWITINQDTMLRGYRHYFNGVLWVDKLLDKNIDWQLAHSINELAEYGYNVVTQ